MVSSICRFALKVDFDRVMEDRSESTMQLDRKEDTADVLSAPSPAQCAGKAI